MRVLVLTVVHHPEDSRVHARQLRAMLDAGWQVTYAAPFTAYDVVRGREPGLRTVDVPRAYGRTRLRALRDVRRLLRRERSHHDLVLLHDPELLLALPGTWRLPAVVWDVHEDTAAAVRDKEWLPRPVRALAVAGVRLAERWAEHRTHLLLAEPGYRSRFRREHLVVPNTVRVPDHVPDPGPDRVVHLGTLTEARGAREVVAVAEALAPHGVTVDVIGDAHGPVAALLRSASDDDVLRWHGFLPAARALALLPGALAGLSLLRDTPNYRVSTPTKVLEYMAHGVPVVTTPLPLAAELVTGHGCGTVVPFEDPDAAADAVLGLRADGDARRRAGVAGHAAAAREHDWTVLAAAFLAELERVARR